MNVYANASSTRVSTTALGVTVQATATWTTAADIPAGNWFDVIVVGGGGGGGGGGVSNADATSTSEPGKKGGDGWIVVIAYA